MRLTRRITAIAGTAVLTVAGVVLIQPAAFAGPVGSGWTEHKHKGAQQALRELRAAHEASRRR